MASQAGFRYRLLLPVFILALIAGACGSDSAGTDSAADVTDSVAPDTTVDGAVDESPDEPTVTDPPEIELTATDRGVTADTIHLGYVDIDWEAVNTQFNQTRNDAPVDEVVKILQDDLNERGGILGRQVEVEVKRFLPVGSESVVQVCTELVEDTETFLVMSYFQGQGVQDGNLCLNDTNETLIIGGPPGADELARSRAAWITPNMNRIRRAEGFAQLLADTGTLAELGPIGIIVHFSSDVEVGKAAEKALVAAGATVTQLVQLPDNGGDTQATEALVSTAVERFRSDGVQTIYSIGPNTPVISRLLLDASDLKLMLLDGDAQSGWPNNAPENLASATAVISNATPLAIAAEEPAMAECLALIEEKIGFELKTQADVGDGEKYYLGGAFTSCQYFAMFEQVAVEAGPDLTTESFTEAIGSIGDIVVPGYEFASLAADKYDARDSMSLVSWNGSSWDVTSEQFNVVG